MKNVNKIFILLIAILCIGVYVVFFSDLFINEQKRVSNIIMEKGYSSQMIENGVNVEFVVQKDWLPEQKGEKSLNVQIAKLYESEIILRNVTLNDRSYEFNFEVVTHTNNNRKEGELLSIVVRHNEHTVFNAGPPEKWSFYSKDGENLMLNQKITSYSSGSGNGNLFNFGIEKKYIELLDDQMRATFSGLAGYEYSKK